MSAARGRLLGAPQVGGATRSRGRLWRAFRARLGALLCRRAFDAHSALGTGALRIHQLFRSSEWERWRERKGSRRRKQYFSSGTGCLCLSRFFSGRHQPVPCSSGREADSCDHIAELSCHCVDYERADFDRGGGDCEAAIACARRTLSGIARVSARAVEGMGDPSARLRPAHLEGPLEASARVDR